MICGIYALVNTISGKRYVGSALNIQKRTAKHFHYLAKGKHPSSRLTAAYAVHGESAFVAEVLEECAATDLLTREAYWMAALKPAYNARLVPNNNLGLAQTAAHKDKIAASLRATSSTLEARERLRKTVTDSWQDPEVRARRTASLKKTWDLEKRAAWSTIMKQTDTKAKEAGAIRWAKPGASERASAALRASHARRGPPNTEAMIRDKVAETPGWTVVSFTGTRVEDTVVVRCDIHGREETRTVTEVLRKGRGCKLCGYARSSAKQKGRSKVKETLP